MRFKSKKVYVLPYLDSLHNAFYLKTNVKEFESLSDTFEVLNQIDSLSGQEIESNFYKRLKFELTDDTDKADIKLSFTPLISYKGSDYCIIQIAEGEYKKWVIKLKERDGEIVANEVTRILD